MDDKEFGKLTKESFKEAQKLRKIHENEMNQCLLFTTPARELYATKGKKIDRSNLYDSTAVSSLYSIATFIEGMSVPSTGDWAKVKPSEEFNKPMMPLTTKVYVDRYNKILNAAFTKGGFKLAWGTALIDICGPGTGVIAVSKKDGQTHPRFVPYPIVQFYFIMNDEGEYTRIFREHSLTCNEIKERFMKVPDSVTAKIQQQQGDSREDIIEMEISMGGKREYAIVTKENWEIIERKELYTRMYHPIRWNIIPGQPYGDGLVRQALAHIKSANQIRKLTLAYGEFVALGAWQAIGDSVVNWQNTTLKAGKVFATSSELKPLTLPGNFPVMDTLLEREVNAIRTIMMVDAIPGATQHDEKVRTAFETARRWEALLARAGQSILRIEKEGLEAIMKTTIDCLQKSGQLPPVDDQGMKFEYQIESATKRGSDFQEILRDMEVVMAAAQLAEVTQNPNLLKHLDEMKFGREIFLKGGLSPSNMRSEKEVDEILNNNNQQAQMSQMLEMIGQGAGAAKDLNQAGIDLESIAQQGNANESQGRPG